MANHLRVGSLSLEQTDGTEHDTLSSSRLTCDDRETGEEVDVEFLDNREIPYV